MSARIAVLASGGGSNFEALAQYFEDRGPRGAGEIVVVASDRPAAHVLDRARARDIPTAVVASDAQRAADTLDTLLTEHDVDILVLAGYLRLVPASVIGRLRGRIVNVHPALLPGFGGAGMYGRRVHQAVLDAGVTVTGVTVHLVDEAYDRGRIIAQWPVPVLAGDDASRLAARVLRVEHVLYPRVVDALAAGRLTGSGDEWRAALPDNRAVFTLAIAEHDDDSPLGNSIAHALDI